MQILGTWFPCDDGTARPTVRITVRRPDSKSSNEDFLVDARADCTVLSAGLLDRLPGATRPAPSGFALKGITGDTSFVRLDVVLEFKRADGGVASVRGEVAAFTDPASADMCILGRDVLNHFDVIISKPRNEVLLLAGNHRYRVQAA
jgi:hypothetical protein